MQTSQMWRHWTILSLMVLASSACDTVLSERSPGAKLYRKHCSDCHGVDAGGHTVRFMGNLHANLRDDMWKHGGDAQGMERTLREGLVFRHPSYDQLSAEELRQIVGHVLHLRGETAR